MPGITSEVNASSVRTISSHHPPRENKQIQSWEWRLTCRMMNEAQSTIHCGTWTDEKLTDPWICEQDLELYFVAIHLAPWEDRFTLRDIGFLWWAWCDALQHVLGHNAICSTPAHCDAARCYFTLECHAVVRIDFQFILITLWPGTQMIL